MKCPTCNQKTEVLRVQEMRNGTRRRRECPQGHRFTTHERVSSPIAPSCTSAKTTGGISTAPSGEAKPMKRKT